MRTKVQRHRKIHSLISKRKFDVETIQDLVDHLQEAGFKADEETVSRDINELGLVKVTSDNGSRYALPPMAKARNVRIAPRKARLVLDLIRGKKVDEALAILRYTPRAASPIVEKVIRSAVANAEHNFNMDPSRLVIEAVYADEGPTMKRFRPRAMGRASRINKRTSHITVVVNEATEEE